MAKRRGFTAGLSGAAGGAADAFGAMGQRYAASREADRRAANAARVAAIDEVSKAVREGSVTPEQAAAELTSRGVDVTPDLLARFAPSEETYFGKEAAGIDAAKSFEELPTEAGINARLPKRLSSAKLVESNIPPRFQDPSMGVDQLTTAGQGVSEALGAKRRSLTAAIEPKFDPQEYDAKTGAMTSTRRRYDPATQQIEAFDTNQRTPTPSQAGANAATEAIGKQTASNAGGLPELEADAANRLERGTRGEKVATGVATTTAETQAREDVQYSTKNAKRRLDQAYAESLARGQASLSLVGQEVALRDFTKKQQDAYTASTDGLREVETLESLWSKAQPDLERVAQQLSRVTGSERLATMALDKIPRGMLPDSARVYLDAVGASLPYLARLTGEVGNLNQQEQQNAGLRMPGLIDALNGGATGSAKLLRFKALAAVSPKLVELNDPRMRQQMQGRDRGEIIRGLIEDEMRRMRQGGEQGPQGSGAGAGAAPVDMRLTPQGLVPVERPR